MKVFQKLLTTVGLVCLVQAEEEAAFWDEKCLGCLTQSLTYCNLQRQGNAVNGAIITAAETCIPAYDSCPEYHDQVTRFGECGSSYY